MKVTFIIPGLSLSGGIKVVAIYAERLRRRGHHVVVAAGCPTHPPSWRARLRRLFDPGSAPAKPGPSYFSGLDIPLVTLDTPRPIVDADVPDADIVVATWWETAEWAAALSPRKGVKAYFLQSLETWDPLPVERVEATWRLPMHKIVIARWLVDVAREQFGDTDVDLVENSVDTAQFNAPARSKQPVPTAGFLYVRSPVKGHDVLMRAFEIARESLPDLRPVAFGAFPPHPDFPLPPNTDFHLTPAQDKIKDIYAGLDVWVCGSRREGFHLPPLEAMACRTPVVSTRVGGSMEAITEGVSGHLVNIEDPPALAAAMLRVLRLDDRAWRAMSEAAHRRAHQYTWDDATVLLETALQRAIDRAGQRPTSAKAMTTH